MPQVANLRPFPASAPHSSLTLTLLLLVFLPLLCPAANWPTHRATPQRTGLSPASLRLPLQPAWSLPLPPPAPAWSPPARRSYWQRLDHLAARVADDHAFVPILTDDAVLCGSSADDHVRCFDAASGQLRWSFATDGPVRYAPVVDGHHVFFGSDDGWIHAVHLADGSLVWRHRPGPEDRRIPGNERILSVWPVRSGLVVDRGTVFATAGLYPQQGAFACALNAADGTLRWQQPLDVSPEGYLLATDRLLILPTGRASPIGLDRETGTFVRSFDTGGGTYAVASEGELFGGPGNQGTLAAVAAPTGQRLLTVQGRNLVANGPRLHLLESGRLRTLDRARQASLQRQIRELESRIRTLQTALRATNTSSSPRPQPASSADLNAASAALTQARRDLETCELWTTPCPEDLTLIGLQNLLVTGGTNCVAAFDRSSGSRVWEAPVSGRALALAATDQFLAVATDSGSLHVFQSLPAQKPTAPPPTHPASGPALPPSSPLVPLPANLPRLGYALIAGLGSGQLLEALLTQTQLHLVGIDPDPKRIAQARTRWVERGLYGRRLSLHVVPTGRLPFTDFFANLVTSETALEHGTPPAWPTAELERVTRPFGGLRWLDRTSPPVRRGPLEGAGEWTHQFANPGNTASSQDRHLQAQLDLQWFGGPGPDLMVDRHLRGPAPLSSQGRLFIPGENLLVAVDAYNGTVLWQRDLPNSQRYSMPYDAGYLSLSANHLAAAVQDVCWLMSVADGTVLHQWPLPAEARPAQDESLHWGYTVLLDNQLFGTSQKATASRTVPSYEQIDVDYNNDQPLVTGLSLFHLDATTGHTVWHRHQGVLINTTLTLSDQRLFFVEARDPDLLNHPTGRIPLGRLLQSDPWLVALDATSGQTVWETPLGNALLSSRNILYLSAAQDRLVLLGSHRDPSNDTRYTLETRRTSDGTVLWSASHLARVPGEFTHGEQVHHPVLLGDLLVAEPAVYELATGKRLTDASGLNPWNLVRPGHSCGTLSAAGDCLFFRAGNPTVMDLRANLRSSQPPTKLSPSRTGCWINMIPAGGLLLIPEASAGCVCQFSLQTSMGFLPRPR